MNRFGKRIQARVQPLTPTALERLMLHKEVSMAYEVHTSDRATRTVHDPVAAIIPKASAIKRHDQATPITDAIVMTDATGRILFVNEQAEALFGYTAHELVGQLLIRFLPEQFRETHDALMARYAAGPHPRIMAVGVKALGRRRDGGEVQLEISLNPLQGAGALGILCVIRDMTAQPEADQAKDAFLALAAHTLQTPLTALRGNVDTLLLHTRHSDGAELTEWQLETIEEIRWATERLEALADTLLDVTRVQAGQLEIQRETHDLVALVRRVVERSRQRRHTHTFIVRPAAHSLLASLDVRLIEQTLEHLLENAMKYSAPGETIEISVRRRPGTGEALIQVRDHGVGIPNDQRERIFTRFGGQDNQAALAGTGLRLYLCRQFIERHGGRIGVGNTRGRGARLWFTLPPVADTADEEATH
jgi:PAS domain S-box-containing protein